MIETPRVVKGQDNTIKRYINADLGNRGQLLSSSVNKDVRNALVK